jgi:hypothetical protein
MVGYNWAFSSMFQAELGAGVRYYMAESKFRTTGNPIYEFSNPLSGVGFLVRGALAIVF